MERAWKTAQHGSVSVKCSGRVTTAPRRWSGAMTVAIMMEVSGGWCGVFILTTRVGQLFKINPAFVSDGFIDCADNDCCSADVCSTHINCLASPEPQEVLLREQAPPDTASFFDRVKFLIRENGVQSYVDRNAFDPKYGNSFSAPKILSLLLWVSIFFQARFSPQGSSLGFRGCGFGGCESLGAGSTRRNFPLGVHYDASGWNVSYGWGLRLDWLIHCLIVRSIDWLIDMIFLRRFDLLFNGGGSHIINFQKNNYRDTSTTATLAWNEFGVVDTLKMFREQELAAQSRVGFILPPSAINMDGLVCELSAVHFQLDSYPFWKHFTSGGQGNGPVVYYDAQVLQESVNVSGSDIRLNHVSSRSGGFSSLLLIALTKATIPAGLDQVTVRITNAGVQEETVYEAQPNLSHVYAWNGTNAYKQVVYGFSSAKGISFSNTPLAIQKSHF